MSVPKKNLALMTRCPDLACMTGKHECSLETGMDRLITASFHVSSSSKHEQVRASCGALRISKAGHNSMLAADVITPNERSELHSVRHLFKVFVKKQVKTRSLGRLE